MRRHAVRSAHRHRPAKSCRGGKRLLRDTALVSPDGFSLDNFCLARPGADEIQLALLGDYQSNVALYPEFHSYFPQIQAPFLAVWGKNDPFFLPVGAEAFKRDIPNADVRFFDTGHFALETHTDEIAAAIREFLDHGPSELRNAA
jgi:pimeloyl-ACP methyl ester carboxylesterase